jgi:hypothetical protein
MVVSYEGSKEKNFSSHKRLGFDSLYHQIFLEVVHLERGPLSLVKINEELL